MEMTLSVDVLLAAYSQGLFPMAESRDGSVYWFRPDPRAILPLDKFHVPRSLARTVRNRVYDVTFDTAFSDVLIACANREGTWISSEIVTAYEDLHRAGYAHSVESRRGEELVGGLYGVAIGGAFFGESMFHHARDASKVALVHLAEHLTAKGFLLLDTQYSTPHLKQFGVREIPHEQYMVLLSRAIEAPASW